MKKILLSLVCLLAGTALTASCGGGDETEPARPAQPEPEKPGGSGDTDAAFVRGADVSWCTEMEAAGKTFYNSRSEARECIALMKELGLDAIRLRVWVNPEKTYGPYGNAADVLAKARRAKDLGMPVMVDFHYSDFFADPSRQNLPAAWKDMTGEQLRTAVARHTADVLQSLRGAGVDVRWVQVGNETRNGMLWPAGQLWTEKGDIPSGWMNYAALSNAGYDAVKQIYPEALVIVHQNNAWEDLGWWFKKFKAAGGKFDMIGLSHYPQAESGKTWEEVNRLAATHISTLSAAYGVKVMVCEVGVKAANPALGKQVLLDFMNRVKPMPACAGVFYWEPEVYGGWKPACYSSLGWNAYDMGAFLDTGRPSAIMDAL